MRSRPGRSTRSRSKHCFRRLKPYGSVVLLSGDVHYSASTAMSYFTKGETESRALRAVHEQRLQERDAVVHHDDRPQPRARALDRAPTAGCGAHGLVAQAVQSHRSRRRQDRGGHPARVSSQAQAGTDAAADDRLAGGHDDQSGAAVRTGRGASEPIFDVRAGRRAPGADSGAQVHRSAGRRSIVD